MCNEFEPVELSFVWWTEGGVTGVYLDEPTVDLTRWCRCA